MRWRPRAMVLYGIAYAAIFTFWGVEGVPRTVGLIQPMLLLLLVGASRAAARVWLGGLYHQQLRKAALPQALIYGAGSAGRHPHHAYLFANARANRMKVLVHDGVGVWLAARRLNTGKFVWGDARLSPRLPMNAAQLSALALGLPWQRMGDAGVITVL